MFTHKPDHCFNKQTKKTYVYKVGGRKFKPSDVYTTIRESDEWKIAFEYVSQLSKKNKTQKVKPQLTDDEKAKRKVYQAEYRKRKKAENIANIANIQRIRGEDAYKNTHGIDYEHQLYAIINNQTDDVLHLERKRELLKLANENKFDLLPVGIKRRVVLRIATPPWSDKDKIRALYLERDRRNKFETDDPWEVDHFYPILGKTVTGLHSHQNLVLIRRSENIMKSNKHPDTFYE